MRIALIVQSLDEILLKCWVGSLSIEFANALENYMQSQKGMLQRTYDFFKALILIIIYNPIATFKFLGQITTLIFLPKFAGKATGEYVRVLVN